MGFRFYGQSCVVDELLSSFERAEIAHGFFITGPEGCGKRTLASLLAKAFLCQGKHKPCGQCRACRLIEEGAHPDYILLQTEKSALGVGEARELIDALAEHPFSGERRAVLIVSPLTIQAQNALLKTLEGPPAGTVFFLTATTPTAFLPTVVSRLQLIALHALDEQTCAQALQERGIAPDRAKVLAKVSGGIVGRALQLDGDERYWHARQKARDFIRPIGPAELPAFLQEYTDIKEDEQAFMSCLQELLAGVIRVHLGADGQEEARRAAQVLSLESACRLQDDLILAQQKRKSNVSWQVVVQSLAFALVEETKGW